jgi:hypothetical protein
MARKRIAADELKALPKANSYRRGAHGEDGLGACNKHVDMVKQGQNTALDHTLHSIPQHSTRNAEKKGFMCTLTHLRARSVPKWNHLIWLPVVPFGIPLSCGKTVSFAST